MRKGLLALGILTACHSAPPPTVAMRDVTAEARVLVEGAGALRTCRNDHDCAVGPSQAACVLGACFGILSADSRTARQLVVSRLQAADLGVRKAAWPLLRKALDGADTSPLKVAAVDGAGALLEAEPDPAGQCGPICEALRRQAAATDEHVAAAARLALGRAGDPTVVAALAMDLMRGTELQRTEAVRALVPAVKRGDAAAIQVVQARLQDPSPIVAEAALRALTPVIGRAELQPDLATLRYRAPHLAYAIDAVRAGAGK
jgi:hypothetical protein